MVSELVERLKSMPQDAEVKYFWDGKARSSVTDVYWSRKGDVVFTDGDETFCIMHEYDQPQRYATLESAKPLPDFTGWCNEIAQAVGPAMTFTNGQVRMSLTTGLFSLYTKYVNPQAEADFQKDLRDKFGVGTQG